MKALEYWIDKYANLIPNRFSKEMLLQFAYFILTNNYTEFDKQLWHQLLGTSMGSSFASPYACLTVGYLEETILFPRLLPSVFNEVTCKQIMECFFRFVDDGITLLPKHVQKNVFLDLLNKMDPSIQFTIGETTTTHENFIDEEKITFLAIIILLSESGEINTDVFYKETNNHDYLNYSSHHPQHVKDNIPYTLAKRIIVFTSRDVKVDKNLNDLYNWLIECDYPPKVIKKGIHNAKLQGPAPPPSKQTQIPLISTYYSNYNNNTVIEMTKSLITQSKDERVIQAFKDVHFINSLRQPPNLLRKLCNSQFISNNTSAKNGLFKCKHQGCKICKLYLQECESFETANGVKWKLKCYIDCNSSNVLYYLMCNACKEVTYTGKTDSIRLRTNNHITGCRHGNSSNKFDQHVYNCSKNLPSAIIEPFFKLYAFLKLSDYHKLRSYENLFHARNYDTLNAKKVD